MVALPDQHLRRNGRSGGQCLGGHPTIASVVFIGSIFLLVVFAAFTLRPGAKAK